MATRLRLQTLLVCLQFCGSILAVAGGVEWGEWSTWSPYNRYGSCETDDVIMTSTRNRTCSAGEHLARPRGCRGQDTEVRMCLGNCSSGAEQCKTIQVVSLTDATGAKLKDRGQRSSRTKRNSAPDSRQPRAADLLSFLSDTPAQSKNVESEIANSDDLRKLFKLAESAESKSDKADDAKRLQSLQHFIQELPEEDMVNLNDILQLENASPSSNVPSVLAHPTPATKADAGISDLELIELISATEAATEMSKAATEVLYFSTLTEEHISPTETPKGKSDENEPVTETPIYLTEVSTSGIELEDVAAEQPVIEDATSSTETPTSKLQVEDAGTQERRSSAEGEEAGTRKWMSVTESPSPNEEEAVVWVSSSHVPTSEVKQAVEADRLQQVNGARTVQPKMEASQEYQSTPTFLSYTVPETAMPAVISANLLEGNVEEPGVVHDKVPPLPSEKMTGLIDTAQETSTGEEIANVLNEAEGKQPVEVTSAEAGSLPVTTATSSGRHGEDLLHLINDVKETQEGGMPDLESVLDEISQLSQIGEDTGKDLDDLSEILDIVQKPKSGDVSVEPILVRMLSENSTLLPLPNKTEPIDKAHILEKLENNLQDLAHIIQINTSIPGEVINKIVDKIDDLKEGPSAVYSQTLPVTTSPDEGEFILDMIHSLKNSEMRNSDEKHHLQVLDDLFDEVLERNEDVLGHEINKLNHLINPTASAPETSASSVTSSMTLNPSEAGTTTVAKAKVLEFLGEMSGLADNEHARSKEEMDNINDFFGMVGEADRDVLGNEVRQLLRLLIPSSAPSTSSTIVPTSPVLPQTEVLSSSQAGEALLLNIIGGLGESERKRKEQNYLRIQEIQDLLNGVKEPNKDELSHEIEHLGRLLNPTTISTEEMVSTLPTGYGETTRTPSGAVDKERLLEFVGDITGMKTNETMKSKQEIDDIYDILNSVAESDQEVLGNEVHQLLQLLVPSTAPSKEVQTSPATLFSTSPTAVQVTPETTSPIPHTHTETTSILSTAAQGALLIDMIEDFKEVVKDQDLANRHQIQELSNLFDSVEESNKDVLSHEINHLNQLLNPTSIATRELSRTMTGMGVTTSQTWTKESSTVLPTVATTPMPVGENEQMVDIMSKIAAPAGRNESLGNREEINDIQAILERVHESDKEVLGNEVNELLRLILVPSTVTVTEQTMTPFQRVSTTAVISPTFTIPTVSTSTSVGGESESLLDMIQKFAESTEKQREDQFQIQKLDELFDDLGESGKDVLDHEINHLNHLLNQASVSTSSTKPTSAPSTTKSTEVYVVPTSALAALQMLDLVKEIVGLKDNEILRGNVELEGISTVLENIPSMSGNATGERIRELFDSLFLISTPVVEGTGEAPVTVPTEVPLVKPTMPGQYLLNLLNRTDLINPESLVGELHQDLNLVDGFLKTSKQISSEDLMKEAIRQIELLLEENITTPSVMPSTSQPISTHPILSTGTTYVTKEQLLLDLIETIAEEQMSGEVKNKDIHPFEVMLQAAGPEKEDIWRDELHHLEAILNIKQLTTPTAREEVERVTASSSPFTPHVIENVLNLLDRIPDFTGRDKTESGREFKNIQDVLKEAEAVDKDILPDEIKHLEKLLQWAVASTSQRNIVTHVPTTVSQSKSPPSIITNEANENLVIDLIEDIAEAKMPSQGIKDIQSFETLLKTSGLDKEDILKDELSHLKHIFFEQTSAPTSLGTTFTESATFKTTNKVGAPPSTTNANQVILDLMDEISALTGKDQAENTQEVHNLQDVLKEVNEPDSSLFSDDIKHLLGLQVPHTTKTTQKPSPSLPPSVSQAHGLTATEEVSTPLTPTVQPMFTSAPTPGPAPMDKFILHFLQEIHNISKSRLQTDFQQDVDLVDQFVETSNLDIQSDLGKAINDIGALVSKALIRAATPRIKTVTSGAPPELPETTVSPTSVVTSTVEVATFKPGNQQLLDLIENLGETNTETMKQNNLEVQKLEEILVKEGQLPGGILKEELDHLNDVLNPGLYSTETTGYLKMTSKLGVGTTASTPVVTSEELTLPEKHVAHTAGYPSTSGSSELAAIQALLDLLSRESSLNQGQLFHDAAEMQQIADVFANLNQTDQEVLFDEIAKLDYGLHHGKEPTLTHHIAEPQPTKEVTRTTPVVIPLIPGRMVPPTETTAALPSTEANDEAFLDTLLKLRDQMDMGVNLDDVSRLGALTEEQQYRGAQEDLKEGLEFVWEILKDATAKPGTSLYPPSTTAFEISSTLAKHLAAPSLTTTEESPKTPAASDGESFLDTLRDLIGNVDTRLPWADIERVGALSGSLDKEAEKQTAEELGFVEDLLSAVREWANGTAGTTHAPKATFMTSEPWQSLIQTAISSKSSTPPIEKSPSPRTPTQPTPNPTTPTPTTRTPTPPYLPMDQWTDWSSWGDCSATCGLGEQSRTRECQLLVQGLVIPAAGCEGSRAETMACETRPCPVVTWAAGTTQVPSAAPTATQKILRPLTTITIGIETTSKSPGSPSPTTPTPTTPIPTTTPYLPMDQWTDWSSWGDCSATCGLGEQSRTRECQLLVQGLVIPAAGCEGSRAETMACETRPCPDTPRVDGQWSVWSQWTTCSALCGPGRQTRHRLCDSPHPAGEGALPCEGAMAEDRDCYGEGKLCEEAGVKAAARSTPRPSAHAPTRRRVHKLAAWVVLIVFVIVLVAAGVLCSAVKIRRVFGARQYRAGKPIFTDDAQFRSAMP